jgi:hypothetical protein
MAEAQAVYNAKDFTLDTLPRHLRNAVAMNGSVELSLSGPRALELARRLELAAALPKRVTIVPAFDPGPAPCGPRLHLSDVPLTARVPHKPVIAILLCAALFGAMALITWGLT